MASDHISCSICLKGLNFLIDLGIFICICILCSLSSSNPLKSHIIGNETNYFVSTLNYNFSFTDNSSLDDNDFDNFQGKNKKRQLNSFKTKRFRKLESDSFCTDMQYSFVRNKDKKLSYIFDLKYSLIRKFSFVVIFLSIGMYAFSIPVGCYLTKKHKFTWWVGILAVVILLLWLARMIITFLLFFYVEKGDIEKYDDFLDCPNVKKKYFENFSDIEKLRKCFLAYAVFNIISYFIDKVSSLVDSAND